MFGAKPSTRHLGFRFAMKGGNGKPNGMMRSLGLKGRADRNRYAKVFALELDRELQRRRPEKVLFSDEALFLYSEEPMIEAAAAFLRGRFEEVRVLCHIRHPIDYVRSRMYQGAKNGAIRDFDAGIERCLRNGLYVPALSKWARHFEPHELEVSVMRSDTIVKMLKQMGQSEIGQRPKSADNRSLTAQGIGLLLALNKHYSKGTRPDFIRDAFAKSMTGKPFDLPPRDCAKVWNVFKEERAQLLEKFLYDPEDIRLVSEDWRPLDTNSSPEDLPWEVDLAVRDLLVAMSEAAEKRRRRRAEAAKRKVFAFRMLPRVMGRSRKPKR
ncbi:MAG: hypothetical protein LJE62_16350 [Silicimonas sp.]|nr:hypothetical protein [Silicimonas sp.]